MCELSLQLLWMYQVLPTAWPGTCKHVSSLHAISTVPEVGGLAIFFGAPQCGKCAVFFCARVSRVPPSAVFIVGTDTHVPLGPLPRLGIGIKAVLFPT